MSTWQIQMCPSGEYVYPGEPWRWVPRIEDIAYHLAGINRFTGGTRCSVAQHSVLVCDETMRTDPASGLWALLHDAAEAYIGDAPSPWKHSGCAGADEYRRVERALQERICNHFMLPHMEPLSVRDADARLAVSERRDLLPRDPAWRTRPGWAAYADVEPLAERISPWPAWVARSRFLERYQELTNLRRRAA